MQLDVSFSSNLSSPVQPHPVSSPFIAPLLPTSLQVHHCSYFYRPFEMFCSFPMSAVTHKAPLVTQ